MLKVAVSLHGTFNFFLSPFSPHMGIVWRKLIINVSVTHIQKCFDNTVKNFAVSLSHLNSQDLVLALSVKSNKCLGVICRSI